MIKLIRPPKPSQLTSELQAELTEKFKHDGSLVWQLSFLRKALLELSHGKCCYCEVSISEESKYMEIDHFHNKIFYKDEVLVWENLLPACKRCNVSKSSHDTVKEPIINPCDMDPRIHLRYWRYRIKGQDALGKMTISVLDLNNQERLVKRRFEIGNAIQAQLESIGELVDDYMDGIQSSTRRRNRIVNGLKELMREGLPTASYAATSATIILTDNEYTKLRAKFSNAMLWDAELTELEVRLSNIAFALE